MMLFDTFSNWKNISLISTRQLHGQIKGIIMKDLLVVRTLLAQLETTVRIHPTSSVIFVHYNEGLLDNFRTPQHLMEVYLRQ